MEHQMPTDNSDSRNLSPKELTEVLIRITIIITLAVLCFRIFAPFMNLMLWALILAVALYPMHQGLARRLGGKPGRSATLLVLAGLLIIGVPTVILGSSFAGQVHHGYTALENNEVTIKQPAPSVAEWPVVGERVYGAWSAAANDLPAFLKENEVQVKSLSRQALATAASTAGAVLLFLGSLIAAGIMMAYGESGSRAVERILVRFTEPGRGQRLQVLCTQTVRSVATGVIGVAFIQALLLGVGFLIAGIPAAGVLAVVVMLLGILQLPALLISLPAIAWLWSSGDASTTANIAYTAYLLVAGFADNVLKPLLLGRGVDAPMPIILLGALGGMVSAGIVGLFVGAVLLAVGYQIFMDWVGTAQADTDAPQAPAQTTGQ